jgi:hypothetical protein
MRYFMLAAVVFMAGSVGCRREKEEQEDNLWNRARDYAELLGVLPGFAEGEGNDLGAMTEEYARILGVSPGDLHLDWLNSIVSPPPIDPRPPRYLDPLWFNPIRHIVVPRVYVPMPDFKPLTPDQLERLTKFRGYSLDPWTSPLDPLGGWRPLTPTVPNGPRLPNLPRITVPSVPRIQSLPKIPRY